MSSPAHRSLLARGCRAWVFAVICVLLSAAGHSLVTEHPLSLSMLGPAVAFVAAFAWSVADRRRGLLSITSGLLVGQGLLHLWFNADPTGGHTGHGPATGGAAESQSAAMLAVHITAALVCGIWLWCGERTAFSLATTLYTRIVLPLFLFRPLPVIAAPAVDRPATDDAEPTIPVEILRHAVARRGPPGAARTPFLRESAATL